MKMPMDERAYMTKEEAKKTGQKERRSAVQSFESLLVQRQKRGSKLCTAQNKVAEKTIKSSLFCTMKIYTD